MGFLDGLIKGIESGGLEKAVVNAVDGFESKVDKAVGAIDKAASKLPKSGQNAEAKVESPESRT